MLNKVILIGHLGNDPELKNSESGSIATFSIATTESWKDKDGNKKEQTEWHKCVVFGKRADTVNMYCHKGSKLYVEGKIQYRM